MSVVIMLDGIEGEISLGRVISVQNIQIMVLQIFLRRIVIPITVFISRRRIRMAVGIPCIVRIQGIHNEDCRILCRCLGFNNVNVEHAEYLLARAKPKLPRKGAGRGVVIMANPPLKRRVANVRQEAKLANSAFRLQRSRQGTLVRDC